jgi:Family of unknown function (DUF5670)
MGETEDVGKVLLNRIFPPISATSVRDTKQTRNQPKGISMLWTIFVILLVLWLLGFIGHVGGGLIHLLLVIAVVVLIINLVSGRRSL